MSHVCGSGGSAGGRCPFCPGKRAGPSGTGDGGAGHPRTAGWQQVRRRDGLRGADVERDEGFGAIPHPRRGGRVPGGRRPRRLRSAAAPARGLGTPPRTHPQPPDPAPHSSRRALGGPATSVLTGRATESPGAPLAWTPPGQWARSRSREKRQAGGPGGERRVRTARAAGAPRGAGVGRSGQGATQEKRKGPGACEGPRAGMGCKPGGLVTYPASFHHPAGSRGDSRRPGDTIPHFLSALPTLAGDTRVCRSRGANPAGAGDRTAPRGSQRGRRPVCSPCVSLRTPRADT